MAELSPTGRASMREASPGAAINQKEWRVVGVASGYSARGPVRIVNAPKIKRGVKAIQWSQSATNSAAMEPRAHPTNGVMASITPKIIPVLSASDMRGLRREVPLPTAAANASVDIANARIIVERSEEHTSELQSLMRISYAIFCLKHHTTNKEVT